ncbi:hypothetical protein CL644_01825 [bacterium]|nr:hypothetical protein [bacterium]|tara:strand:- start:20112 stop:21284 length:1173 start_codon:yes stop_codon:yes gene_type:complete
MNEVIKTLDRYFDALINQERDWYFFLGLVDYVNLIDELPSLKPPIKKFVDEEEVMLKKIRELEKNAVEELKIIASEIEKIAKKIKKSKDIKDALVQLKEYDEGKIEPTYYHSTRISYGIKGLIKAINENGGSDSLKKVLPPVKEGETVDFSLYEVSPSYKLRSTLSYGFHKRKEDELWGHYEKLRLAGAVFQKGTNLEKAQKLTRDENELTELIKEYGIIKNEGSESSLLSFSAFDTTYGSEKRKYSSSSDRRIREFKRDKYQNYITRIHNYFIKELTKANLQEERPKKDTVAFDPDRSVLVVSGKEIKFRKYTEQYHTLRIIFKTPEEVGKEWFFSEIAEKIDPRKGYSDKDFHNYMSAIKRRVSAETSVLDLFITTNQSLKINSKFLR